MQTEQSEKESQPSVAVCKFWARGGRCNSERCPFRHRLLNDVEVRRAVRAAKQRAEAVARNVECDDPFEGSQDSGTGVGAHGDDVGKDHHGARHVEFARWLLKTFDASLLASGVLDVAGGRGRVAFELHCKRGVPCTLLEPRPLTLTSSQRKFLRKQPSDQPNCGPFTHVQAMLDDTFEASAEGRALLQRCTLVGMHPDEATEQIVDAALKFGRPFAVLPCCVFATAFPHRANVGTYRKFCDYIVSKSDDIQVAFLPFEGRNKVIYRNTSAPPQPGWQLKPPVSASRQRPPESAMRVSEQGSHAGSTTKTTLKLVVVPSASTSRRIGAAHVVARLDVACESSASSLCRVCV
jgi:hypothetical protein